MKDALVPKQLDAVQTFMAKAGLKLDRARTLLKLAAAIRKAIEHGEEEAEAVLAAEFEQKAVGTGLRVVWAGPEPLLFRVEGENPIHLPKEDKWPPSWTRQPQHSITLPGKRSHGVATKRP